MNRTPISDARLASRGVMIPLSPTGSFVVFISQSTSSHVSRCWKLGSGPRGFGATAIAARGPPCHLAITLGMEQDETAHRRDGNRPRQTMPEQGRREIDLPDVDEHVLADREAVEASAIATHRRLGFRAARAEVPRLARQARMRGATNLGKRDELRFGRWGSHDEGTLYGISRHLEEARGAHASTDAHRADDQPGAATLALDERVADHTRPAHPVRMPDGDRAAVDVQAIHGDAELVPAVEHLHRKGFVELPEIDVAHLQAVALEQARHREHRADPHLIGLTAGDREAAEDA